MSEVKKPAAEEPLKETPPPEEKKKKEDKKAEARLAELESALKQAQEDAAAWKNKYYMAYADAANLTKQNEKTLADALRYRAMGFVEKLVPALDSFHIALTMGTPSPEVKNYLVGFEYIYRQLTSVLDEEGVKEIDPPLGSAFDHQTMHAVDAVESDGPVNLIVRVMAKGYILKDRIVRPAMVVVSKAKPVPAPEPVKPEAASQDETKKEESKGEDARHDA